MFELIKRKVVKITTNWAREGMLNLVDTTLDNSLERYRDSSDIEDDELTAVEDYHSHLQAQLEERIDDYFKERI